MALEMIALRPFIGIEGNISRGELFQVATQERFNLLQKWGIATDPAHLPQQPERVETFNFPLELTTHQANSAHFLKHKQIEGEYTEIATLYREGNAYTVFQIEGPPDDSKEATLTLMREKDPETGGPEFVDLYNMNYPAETQTGIRIQKRGSGKLRDFVIDFFDGQAKAEAIRVHPDKSITYGGNQHLKSGTDQIIVFDTAEGSQRGYFGSLVTEEGKKRLAWVNSTAGSSFEIFDNGNIVIYQPIGEMYFYSDQGAMFFNDRRILTQDQLLLNSPDGTTWKIQISDTGELSAVKV